MPDSFFEKCEILIQERTGIEQGSWNDNSSYSGGLLIKHGGIVHHSYVMFPILNNSLFMNYAKVYFINKQAFDKLRKQVISGENSEIKEAELDNLKRESYTVDTSNETLVEDFRQKITIQANNANSNKEWPPGFNAYQLTIKLKNKEDLLRIQEITNDFLVYHEKLDSGELKSEIAPRCKCGSYKIRSTRYNNVLFKQNLPGISKYSCPRCTALFCGLYDDLHKIARDIRPNVDDPRMVLGLLDTILGIARSLHDKLGLATAKALIGNYTALITTKKNEGIHSIEESYDFLKHYSDYRDEDFYQQMEQQYTFVIFDLAQHYLASGQHDKALPLLYEGLKIDENHGNELDAAMSKTSIGRALVASGKFKEAEKLLLDALKIKESAANISPNAILSSLLGLIELYTATREREKLKLYLERVAIQFSFT
nr:tetratricopeptide repeat protein [Candidatus Sigynarchaeota archaeon]